MSRADPLPSEAKVLRLVKRIERFIPTGAKLPTWEAFLPSTDDAQEAAQRASPVRVSVWDASRTTISQARAFRKGVDVEAYQLSVAQAHAAASALPRHALR